MIRQEPIFEDERTYVTDSAFEKDCFTLFWNLHDVRRPGLTRKTVEMYLIKSKSIDKEIEALLATIELPPL